MLGRSRPSNTPGRPTPVAGSLDRLDDDASRLDPVRWRRPGRSALLRWTAVAVLLGTAAAAGYARDPARCTPAMPSPATAEPSAGAPSGPPTPLEVPRGSVGVPVRLAEPAALALLHPGDRVDLMASASDGPRRVATNALVLNVHPADDPGAGLFLAVTADEAHHTVDAPPDTRLAVLVRPPE
jgi:hypothetical protein